jgi:hypothetical protein
MAGQVTPDQIAKDQAAYDQEQGTAAQTAKDQLEFYGSDVGRSAASGLVQGGAGIAGLPGDLSSLGVSGLDYLMRYLGYRPSAPMSREDASRIVGYNISPQEQPQYAQPSEPIIERFPTSKEIEQAAKPYLPEWADPAYQSQSGVGQFTQYAGRMLPFGISGGASIPGAALRTGVRTAVPAGGALAGQTLEGGALGEGAGALTGAVIASVLSRRPTTAEAAIRSRLPADLTQGEVADARVLMNDAISRGVTLTWPEAISQVRVSQGRSPAGLDMQRLVESVPRTRQTLLDFMQGRPQQVSGAFEGAAQTGFGPASTAPSTLGPGAAAEATATEQAVRQAINTTARPWYNAAENVQLGPAEMARVQAIPGFAEMATAVRNDPFLNSYVSHLPDNSVGFLNAVKQQLDAQAATLRSPLNPQANLTAASAAGTSAGDVRAAGRAATPAYGVALDTEERLRRTYLDPILQGPLGKLANAPDTQRAIGVLFARNPLPGSEREISDAVGAVAARRPALAEQLVRAHTEMVFNEAARSLGAEGTQFTGAKFAINLAGNPQQRANLRAAIEALPNGAARWQGFENFLNIVEATGHRMRPGSLTSFNSQEMRDLADSGALGETAKTVTSPGKWLSAIGDRWSAWQLGRNLDEIARIVTDPAAAPELARLARMPPMSRYAFLTALRITGQTGEGARGPTKPTSQQPGE